jgi:N-acetylglucosamine kinase-like BadF-type ATPase
VGRAAERERGRGGDASTALLLGVDVGGTRSTAMLVDGRGALVARTDGGPGNYQSIGVAAARASLDALTAPVLAAAGSCPIEGAAYGVAGADRAKDYAAIEALLPPLPSRRVLVNDSELVLRAGTRDGVGVALVSGTGTNAVGRNRDGAVARVGGFCDELGDFGSAGDLGREALRLAMRGREGRGAPTVLYEMLCDALGVAVLEDVMDRWMNGDGRDLGALAPLVFEAATTGDAVARGLLERAGEELALAGRLVCERLFRADEPVTVVLGGSVLQRGSDPTLVLALARALARARPGVRVVKLRADPIVGALLLAHDLASGRGLDLDPLDRFATRLGATPDLALSEQVVP